MPSSTLAETGPAPLHEAFARFTLLARMLGTVAALEVVKEELADPTSDRVIEVLILAYERGGPIVQSILEDLVAATTKDVKVLDEIESEGLEMKINARAVLVMPWFVLVALTVRAGPFREFYGSPAGLLVVLVGAGAERTRIVVDQSTRTLAPGAAGLRCCAARPGDDVIATPVALGCVSAAVAAVGVAALAVPPTRRLAPRVRPYTVTTRAQLGRGADVAAVAPAPPHDSTLGRLFGPPLRALVARLGRLLERRSDDTLDRQLRQAGYPRRHPRRVPGPGCGAGARVRRRRCRDRRVGGALDPGGARA